MTMMPLILEYTKSYIKELTRNYSAAFFALLFPAILVQIFGNYSAIDNTTKMMTYIVYCNYAVQSVMLQALGITIATARANQWNEYIKTLPTSSVPMIIGRVLSNLFFSTISLGAVILVWILNHGIELSMQQQGIIIFCALFGGIPMALLAIFLGNLLNATAARSALVLLNILLLFTAFTFSSNKILNFIHGVVPSYQWMMFSASAVSKQLPIGPFVWLVGYSLVFYALIRFSEKMR